MDAENLYADLVAIKKRCEEYRLETIRLKREVAQRVDANELECLQEQLDEARDLIATLKGLGAEKEALMHQLEAARRDRNEMLKQHNVRMAEAERQKKRADNLGAVNVKLVSELKRMADANDELREEIRQLNRKLESEK